MFEYTAKKIWNSVKYSLSRVLALFLSVRPFWIKYFDSTHLENQINVLDENLINWSHAGDEQSINFVTEYGFLVLQMQALETLKLIYDLSSP